MTRRLPVIAVLALAACAGGCARYQVGPQSLYAGHIQTVYVPIFESAGFRRNEAEWLTEAVIKEIELRTSYKVVGSPEGADSILTGRISAESKGTSVISPMGLPRQQDLNMSVRVKWTDRRGDVLREGPPMAVDSPFVDVSATGRVAPEMGHSVVTAQQDEIRKVAAQIVSLMEAPW